MFPIRVPYSLLSFLLQHNYFHLRRRQLPEPLPLSLCHYIHPFRHDNIYITQTILKPVSNTVLVTNHRQGVGALTLGSETGFFLALKYVRRLRYGQMREGRG